MSITPSVVVCTRDRNPWLRKTIASILATLPDGVQLVLVDQGQEAHCMDVLDEMPDAARRVTLVRSEAHGAGPARNDGARAASGDLLIYTDDDCVVPDGWVDSWCRLFEAEPDLGIAFGRVTTPLYDPSAGYIPSFEPIDGRHGIEIFKRGAGAIGLGGNMAVRRDALQLIGGFDELLGAGSPYPAAEEVDIGYRVAQAGYRVALTTSPCVIHYGYRSHAAGFELMQRYVFGTAGMYMKHVRSGDYFALRLLLYDTWLHLANVGGNVMRARRPLGIGSLLNHLVAIGFSFRWHVDQRRRLYVRPSGISANPNPDIEPLPQKTRP